MSFTPVRPGAPEDLGPDLTALVEETIAQVNAAPDDPQAHGTLGLVYEANRLWDEALRSFEHARALDPDDRVWPGHAAKMLRHVGRNDEARELLVEVAPRFPRSATLQHQLGEALSEAGDLEGARAAFERTTELAPDRAEGYIGLGDGHVALGEGAEAVTLLEHALELSPNDKHAHYLLGMAYREVGRLEDALAELNLGQDSRKSFIPDRGARRIPKLVRGFERLLERGIRLTDNEPREALVVLGRCRELQPTNPIVLVNLGVAYQRLDDYDAAHAVLLEADRTNPDVNMVQINLAACLLAMGRPEEALARADRAVVLSPGLARAHTLRGRALTALDRPAAAHAALAESARLEPDDPSVREELGELCLGLGHHDEALVHYGVLCDLLRESWDAHAQLVRAAVLAGDLSLARASLNRALALAPDEPRLAAMADALSALEGGAEEPE